MDQSSFIDHLARWQLTPDGDPIVTHSSRLLPVRLWGAPAMLKIATAPEERRGAAVMAWWDGQGAARVLAHDGDALLLERATGGASLIDMARSGAAGDDAASRILCAAAATLHARPDHPPDGTLVPLDRWFAELDPAEVSLGGILRQAATTASDLLAAPRDQVVLHGDLHHGNVLDFGVRGWLAIDPKGLLGERGFEFANIFCNPDLETAAAPGRLAQRAAAVAVAADLDRPRLLRWILAYAGLSAAWTLGDGDDATLTLTLTIAELAAAELARTTSPPDAESG